MVLILLLLTQISICQEVSDEEKIISNIRFFFDGMRSADTTGLANLLLDDVSLTSVYRTKSDSTRMNKGSMEEFLQAIAKPKDEVWDERIHSYEIKIDGPLAIAWTEYSFYLDEDLLHCGVNVFQLINTNGMWRISAIADTRRKHNCK